MAESRHEDLPQPGDDPEAEERDVARDHPTSGPGNVSVDEPTQTSLDPEAEHRAWGNPADAASDDDKSGAAQAARGAPPGAGDLGTPEDVETQTD